jgi:hypothetical protein
MHLLKKTVVAAVLVGLVSSAGTVETAQAAPAPAAVVRSQASTTVTPAQQSATEKRIMREEAAVAAAKLKAPTVTAISFTDDSVLLSWTKVAHAKKYVVIVEKDGYMGPYPGKYTKKRHIKIPYSWFPYPDGSGKPYVFVVGAINGKKTSVKAHPHMKKKEIVKKTVRTKKVTKATFKKRAKKLAKKCFRDGGSAALGTAIGGGGLMLLTAWIPPAEAVTATGVGLAAAGAGVGTTVACVIIH